LKFLVFGLEGGGAMGVTNQGWEKEKYVLIVQHSGLQRALKYMLENTDVNGRIVLKCVLGKCVGMKWMYLFEVIIKSREFCRILNAILLLLTIFKC
jgi:hypothetical protein